ncbi:MAG: zinc ribbon domain-containing protein [Promethearchaeota archaeon]
MTNINREFREFGDNMFYMLITFILNFVIPVIPGILMLYFMIKALGNIRRANIELKNNDLEEFRSTFISSYILFFIMELAVLIAVIQAVIVFWPYIETQTLPAEGDIPELLRSLVLPIIFLIIGLIFLIAAGISRLKAWRHLNYFFSSNSKLFPEAMGYDAVRGSENMKTASLCYIFGFLLIPILIGLIYELMGYIKLSKLRYLSFSSSSPTKQQVESKKVEEIVYCRECGAQVEKSAGFCSSCGSQI